MSQFDFGAGPNAAEQRERIKRLVRRAAAPAVLLVVLAVLGVGSFYTLNAGEEAVVTRFGSYLTTVQNPGLHFKWPFVDQIYAVNVEGIRRQEFGFRSNEPAYLNTSPMVSEDFIESESLMLTGDENLVNADWAILYKVNHSYNFLFKVQRPEATLSVIAESAYRRVVASHVLDDVLTDRKDEIQREVMADLQAICDKYEMGVLITGVQLQDAMPPDPVREAFLDVSSAKEEQQSKINEAMKYENERLPIASGEAVKLVNDAEAYKQRRINEAEGAVSRYKAIEAEYAAYPDIMRTRLYQEMIREVLPRVKNVYFVDESGETVKFLPIGPSAVLPQQPSS
ncbi:MAG: FtsH protease activity modulator HflK [Oscillospiraceae bacterium]|jgi:membrane protease subunit HflK|nr:FtsH protease activity modulator HflK [Oscillospiraceae bacterium]